MNMDTVISEVAREFNIDVDVLLSKNRSAPVATARMVLYKVLYMAEKSVIQIGIKLNRNHTSVSEGIRKIDKDKKLWKKALDIYTRCYTEEDEFEKKKKRKIIFDKIKKLMNEGKTEEYIIKELGITKEALKPELEKIKSGAQKKVPDYKNGKYKTIYL